MVSHPSTTSFADAVAALSALSFREDLSAHAMPAPAGLAPDAFALAGEVRPSSPNDASEYGTGRFLLLHDAAAPDAWGGEWRVVCFAQAPIEPELGLDPLVSEVAWSWLVDALAAWGAPYHSVSGTATKTLSRGFGGLAAEGEGAQIELRASWSPTGSLSAHAQAWAEVVCMLAGLPPGSEQVEPLWRQGSRHG